MCWKSCWPSQSSSSRSRLSMPCPTATGSTALLLSSHLPIPPQVSSTGVRHRGDWACSTLITMATPPSCPPPIVPLIPTHLPSCPVHHKRAMQQQQLSTTTDAVLKKQTNKSITCTSDWQLYAQETIFFLKLLTSLTWVHFIPFILRAKYSDFKSGFYVHTMCFDSTGCQSVPPPPSPV